MNFRKLAVCAAALSLTATPVLAQSATADLGRSVAPVLGANALANDDESDGSGSILLILAAIAFGLGLYLLLDNESDDPDSP